MQEEGKPDFSADDLALVSDPDDGGETQTGGGEPAKATEKPVDDAAAAKSEKSSEEEKPATKGTIAGGEADEGKAGKEVKSEAEKKADKASLRDVQDWRQEIAEHYAAGDKKAYEKELKRLERISDPRAIYGMYRELEGKFTSGGLIKIPGKDAKPEEIEQFNKALGVPEKPEDYTKNLTLENGAVVGEADKAYVDSFAEHMHKNSARPEEFKAALNWYYNQQEANAAQLDEEDDAHRVEAERALKEEFGSAYKRRTNAIGSVFASAPGGANIENEKSVYARLMGGRTADGRLIGNDPDVIRWLDSIRGEINPAASVVEDGDQSGQTIEAEIKKIEKIMREDRREYNKNYAGRYAELLEARNKIQARA